MILILSIISAILFVYFVLSGGGKWFSRHKATNGLLIVLSLIVLLGSETLTVLNEHSHFGMKNKVSITYKPIYSVIPASKQTAAIPFILLHHDIGKDPIYLYNAASQGKPKMKHSGITDKTIIKTTTQSPYLLIEKKKYVFKNKFYRILFPFSGQNNRQISKTNVFYLPTAHRVMTTEDLQKMQKAMQKQAAMMRKAAEQKAAAAAQHKK
ncbi:MAG: DUF4811 domain-containing protein [Sporolactobacillus sp.]